MRGQRLLTWQLICGASTADQLSLIDHERSCSRPYFLDDGPALRLPEGEQYPHVEEEYPYGVSKVGTDMKMVM